MSVTSGKGSADEKRYSLMELAAELEGVISLGRGDPDLATPSHIIEKACARMRGLRREPLPLPGLGSLRRVLAERYRADKGLDFDPDREILITNGAQEGLFLSILALVDPGDEILLPDPRYGSYDQAVATAGGKIVTLVTGENHDFAMTPGGVAATLSDSPGVKVVGLVNPSNPTGALVSEERVRGIAALARERELAVISDEVYESLVFDGSTFQSMAACPGMLPQTVTIGSVSKAYAMTGFRVGYLLGPAAFIDAAARLKAAISGATPLFSQLAAEAALAGPQENIAEFRRIFAGRREVLMRGLGRLGIPYGEHGGGFFLWADVSAFDLPAETFCRRLLLEERVLMFPGTAFGERWSGYARISMLQSEQRIAEAVDRLEHFVTQAI